MEATINSILTWATTQFNNAVGAVKSLWYNLLDLLSIIKASICDLISSVKARYGYSSETALYTRSTTVPSNPGGKFIEKFKVHRRKVEFEAEVGNPPRKRRRRETREKLLMEKEIELIEDTRDILGDVVEIMKQDLRAASPRSAEKTRSKVQDLLGSEDTERVMTGLRTANLSVV